MSQSPSNPGALLGAIVGGGVVFVLTTMAEEDGHRSGIRKLTLAGALLGFAIGRYLWRRLRGEA